jgi:hypothetical protein
MRNDPVNRKRMKYIEMHPVKRGIQKTGFKLIYFSDRVLKNSDTGP